MRVRKGEEGETRVRNGEWRKEGECEGEEKGREEVRARNEEGGRRK